MQEETEYHKSSVVHGNYSKHDADTGRDTLKQYVGSSPQHLPYYSSGSQLYQGSTRNGHHNTAENKERYDVS